MSEETVPVTVHILEKEYRIACASNHRDGLVNSATLLNDKMQEIRSSGKVIGSDRIAVMAALNIAHDLLEQQQHTTESTQLEQQIRKLREKVDVVVNETKQMEL
ncbi:MAG: cell division protein ZapA [gamma proteobacterium symbiont of Taylorina sp.]|nr:cell division protein ZapA [gamma proteobacterium symbiont of Taylorina sp.]